MKRGIAFVLLGMISFAGGCASPARYVDHQKSDSGIVAIPDNSNVWPNYNMRAAKEMIAKHVGPNFEIVDQYPFKTGRPNTDMTANGRNPSQTTVQDTTEWRLVYRKVAAPATRDQPYGGNPPSGVVQTGGGTAQGLPPGTVPSPLPVGSFR